MKGEIVTTQTEDKVRLHGMYCAPVVANETRFDAVVLTHGLGGNFYSSRFLNYIAHTFLDLGLHVVLGNTRGHDSVNSTVKMGRAQYMGAGFENVSDCQFDLAGWNEFLQSRGHSSVVLAGHSLGAIKSLYAQAHKPQLNVEALVCLSATRLNYQKLMDSSGKDAFQMMLEQAQQLVEKRQGDQLMNVDFPFPTLMAAAAYLDKYGEANEYDWPTFVDQISVPTQLIFGELELKENAAFEGLESEFELLRNRNPMMAIEIVERADHFYSACYPQAAEFIRNWLPVV